MTKLSRKKAVFKNLIVGIAGQLFNQILGFISRTVFIQQLGVVYLGINGLFSNIFSILSLVELGVGSAIIFSLYKPLAEKDESKIEALMSLYSKAYNIIGTVILTLGITLIPFLKYIIKDQPNIPHFILIYFLYLLNTVSSYFFAYKRSLFNADQKNYINVINNNVFTLITKILQIIILIFTKNFLLYLLVQIICTFFSNLDITIRANINYPYIKNKTGVKLPVEDLKNIKKNIVSLFLLRIGSVVVSGTDNLLISSFVGLRWVGIYSNYVMLISIIQAFITQIFNSITASVGNLVNSESKEKSIDIFYKIFFINFIIYSFSCISLFVLLNPFIRLWIGKEFLLPTGVVLLIVFNIYLMGIRNVLWIFNNTLGFFYFFRYMPFIEATINLGVSIILLKSLGIVGVFLGTLTSTVTTYIFAEPYILYKNYFKVSLSTYFVKYFNYMTVLVVTGYIVWYLTSLINNSNWIGFFLKAIITCILICLIFLIVFYRTKEFKYFISLIKNISKNKHLN